MNAEFDWIEEVRGMLGEALPGSREFAGEPEAQPRPDLRVRWAGARLRLHVMSVPAPRIREVEGQLARHILQLKHDDVDRGAVDVIVVGLARFGPRLEGAVREFMGEYGPGIGWGLMDRSEKAVLVIPGLDVEWRRSPAFSEGHASVGERRDRNLFTDLNRWMLKVLLLPDAPAGQWGGPRECPRHATELARIAGVSVSKAHHFAATFRREGFLQKTPDGLRLVRLPALLEAWLNGEKNSSPEILPVRLLLPARLPLIHEGREPEGPSLPREAWRDSAVGGDTAAVHAGISRVGGRQLPLVHVRKPLARAIHDWHLESCDSRDAGMMLVRPLQPQSVFRGVVERLEGPPIVDLWQIALDAVSSGARGREQADFIVERVLALQGRP